MRKKFVCAAISMALVLGGCGSSANNGNVTTATTGNEVESTSQSESGTQVAEEIPKGAVMSNLYLAKSVTENMISGEISSYEYEYDSEARIVSYKSDDVLQFTREYDEKGNLVKQYSYFTYEEGSSDVPLYWVEYKYNDKNQQISECGFNKDGSIDYTCFAETEYYDDSQIKTQIWHESEDVTIKYDYVYNDQGMTVLSRGYRNDVEISSYEIEYYENGIDSKYEHYYNADIPENSYTMYSERELQSNGDTKVSVYEAPYKTEDFVISYENWIRADGTQYKSVNYEDGNVYYIREDIVKNNGLTVSSMYTLADGTPYYTNCYDYNYDENGNLLSMMYYKEDGTINYELSFAYEDYNEFGYYGREVHFNEDGSRALYVEIKYNDKGWPVSRIDYDSTGSIVYERTYEFDEIGNLIKTTYTDGTGAVTRVQTNEYVAIEGKDFVIFPGQTENIY